MTDLLQVSDLEVSFKTEAGKIRAVNGVSYTLGEGEILGVVGESGSGKSVHALAILRLISPPSGRIDAGEIRLRDKTLLTMNEREMRRIRGKEIGMIFQDPISSLNPVLTVGYQLCATGRVHLGLSRANANRRAMELLNFVGIAEPARRLVSYPHPLSGGMRQRGMIAMAIACEPKLIIADEPTTALDVTIQAQIIELVKRLQKEMGLGVIWISHDLGVIAGLAQTVNVMYAGRVIERGSVRSIYKSSCHPYTLGLLGSVPRLDVPEGGPLKSIPGKPPEMSRLPNGCTFLGRCRYASSECAAAMPPVEAVDDNGHVVRCWNWRNVAGCRDEWRA
jgi:oligopeptide/dipeptide ABC transporter ATP-binding protein